ncbi:MAG: sulfur reduction protein DsrE [Candidatus Firestonebacteria bacterium]|nr:sulfur reduction protein DsrE [Candidatus Firestonebacteria bacterium]
MKVAYVFSTPLAHKILSAMIVPQLESNRHIVEVVGMFFFVDNTFLLQQGNDVGERLKAISKKTGMLLMACDICAYERKIDKSLVDGAKIGCFPDLYLALSGVGVDQVITL